MQRGACRLWHVTIDVGLGVLPGPDAQLEGCHLIQEAFAAVAVPNSAKLKNINFLITVNFKVK
jgi:hypothetical protein